VLSRVKLIAEPWDLGEGGYQVGNFPARWSEWNAKYRDAVRAYWKGDGGLIGDLASRLTGSSDLYAHNGRRPTPASTSSPRTTASRCNDLVSYEKKHNEANGEKNRDGESNNLSWNCGAEGATDDPEVLALRARQKRNLLTTLFLSQGVPMLLAGDEMGRSQQGNNNGYNQDNETSWVNWSLSPADKELLAFVSRIVALRKAHPIFRRKSFFRPHGTPDGEKNILWFNPDGLEMSDAEWDLGFARCLGMYLAGDAIGEVSERGERCATTISCS
jgi:isoamylase